MHLINFSVVTTEDILEKVSTYFDDVLDTLGKGSSSLEKKIIFLRKLCKCEFWVAEQFSVEEFQSLGYGEFFTFLEKHISLLPYALQRSLTGETRENISFEACMLKRQLDVILFQASNSLLENENLSEQKISELLDRQFPSICFKLMRSGSLKDIQDVVKENKHNESSNCVLFSATLFGKSCRGSFSDHNVDSAGVGTVIGHNTGVLGSVTAKDAIEALTAAPMLTDLDSWSHWGLVFSPSFGPLVAWLLTEVNAKDLLCLVTKGGKVVRIDHSATLDSYLEAFLQGSSFETAVQLLSLFALYGGECDVPLSLLKCHARKAFEVIINNSLEDEVSNDQKFVMHGKPFGRGHMFDETASSAEYKNRSGSDKDVRIASRFILECLDYLPVEFQSFAAEILLSGLQSVVKEAPSAILNECRQREQRCMLHEVGLSLGIGEWINDYHTFRLTKAHDLTMFSGSSECNTNTVHTQKAEDKFPYSKDEMRVPVVADRANKQLKGVCTMNRNMEVSVDSAHDLEHFPEFDKHQNPAIVIESIRREEFGLDPSLSPLESSMLKKQHARLGRALHCLSQELYSQDSHFLLELVN